MTVKETNEWDNYRAIDLLKRIKREEIHERYIDRHKAFDMAIQALEEVEQYRALGTVEELKEAREKQVAKKPNIVGGEFIKLAECSECNTVIRFKQEYCHKCGNKVNWEEGAENE